MTYDPDYGTILREAADTLLAQLPSTPAGWLQLVGAGMLTSLFIAILLIIAEGLCNYCAHKRAQHEEVARIAE